MGRGVRRGAADLDVHVEIPGRRRQGPIRSRCSSADAGDDRPRLPEAEAGPGDEEPHVGLLLEQDDARLGELEVVAEELGLASDVRDEQVDPVPGIDELEEGPASGPVQIVDEADQLGPAASAAEVGGDRQGGLLAIAVDDIPGGDRPLESTSAIIQFSARKLIREASRSTSDGLSAGGEWTTAPSFSASIPSTWRGDRPASASRAIAAKSIAFRRTIWMAILSRAP